MKLRLMAAYAELQALERYYGVDFIVRAGAYGSAWLVVRDRETGKELTSDEIERLERGRGPKNVPTTKSEAGHKDGSE